LTALLQKPAFGPEALPAKTAFDIATLGGAQVLGLEKSIGSLEAGKCADIALVDRSHPSVATVEDAYSALVYSCSGRDVTDVFIHGREIVRDREHQIFDSAEVISRAKSELQSALVRAKIRR
jgi:5-methylthioadenosine/S-adenosylhomocysteine deaminase